MVKDVSANVSTKNLSTKWFSTKRRENVLILTWKRVLIDAAESMKRTTDTDLGFNVIKCFSFINDDKAQKAGGFALKNPFLSGLRI
jgi:hypothetical protein